jgi:hypothetical protein
MPHNVDFPYLEKLESIEFTPVFILGLHRSGTSILYKLLSKTNTFNIITAYHLLCYNQLVSDYVLSQTRDSKKYLSQQLHLFSEDRGIDRLKLDADFPEEYGFLLGKNSSQMKITKNNYHLFTELCKKIQFINKNTKPLLAKNPFDFQNFLLIKRLYPNARFVFIHRHPYKTLSSTINAVQQIFTQKNWYTSQLFRLYNKIYENPLLLKGVRFIFIYFPILGMMYLCYQMRQSTRYFMQNIYRLDSRDYINIKYESLCADANKTINTIQDFLDNKIGNSNNYQSSIHQRKIKLFPYVEKFKNFIYISMKKYFDYWNYPKDKIE